ncbi:MAG TPA: phosphate ABC transporter permease PtsA, partial [Methylophilaceae bacterium]|nr:phosphate ABC transporter permease PtsA [Methylophilaceae bacterium]
MEFNNARYKRRKVLNQVAMTMSVLTVAIALTFLAWILVTLFSNGFQYLSTAVFAETTPPPGGSGGLSNAIFGSLLMVVFATLIGTPVGILAGTY